MSLIVTLYVPEGIVIAGDSRLTINWITPSDTGNTFHSITGSDSNTKIFSIKEKFGLGTFGNADINGIPISGFITQFTEQKVTEETTIDEMPQLLLDFFGAQFGNPATNFYVIGYNIEEGISVPHAYYVDIANGKFNRVNFSDGLINNGANWGGEIEVVSRLINSIKINNGETWVELPQTLIAWNYMTLQDAIDFATYAIRTTIESLRFQQKEKTVGGPIDILVIKPNEKPIWIKKKELAVE